jgi:PKD repeat protein
MKLLLTIILIIVNFTSGFSQLLKAQFSVLQQTVCVGEPISFTNLSVLGNFPIVSSNWSFGDGTVSSDYSPNHIYNMTGNFTVTLTVRDNQNNSDDEVKVNFITVNANPNVDFTVLLNGCNIPISATFTNIVSQTGLQYEWDFGNGTNSNLTSPNPVLFNSANTYLVKLTAINPNTGCQSTLSKNVIIENYTARIDESNLKVCVGNPIPLQDLSSFGTDNWSWQFEDAQVVSSNQKNPSVIFESAGIKNISLTAQNTVEGCLSTVTKQVIVSGASFELLPSVGCLPLSVVISNTSFCETETVFTWDLPNGNQFTGFSPPNQLFQTYDTFPIKLNVISGSVCTGKSIQDTIFARPILIGFKVNNTTGGCAPLTLNFTDTTKVPNPSYDPIVSWNWNFGDGTTSNEQHPTHTFQAGVFDVQLSVTTNSGCTATYLANDYVKVGHLDSINFTVQDAHCSRAKFFGEFYTNIPYDTSEFIFSWYFNPWIITDNDTLHSLNVAPKFLDTASIDVFFEVNFRGCKKLINKPNSVNVKGSISMLGNYYYTNLEYGNTGNQFITNICNPSLPLTLQYLDASIYGEPSDIIEIEWSCTEDILDTVIYDNDFIRYEYDNLMGFTFYDYGTYYVSHRIRNITTGCICGQIQTINISNIQSNFNLSDTTICKNDSSQVLDFSISNFPLTSWKADFNEFSTPWIPYDSIQNPYRKFEEAGTFLTNLSVKDITGCSASSEKQITVYELPTANFTLNPKTGCSPLTSSIENHSSSPESNINITQLNYSLLDGSNLQTSNIDTSIITTFFGVGLHAVSLQVQDQNGCFSLPFSENIEIVKPTVNFEAPSVVCKNEIGHGFSTSIGYGNLNYNWFLNDNFSSSNDSVNFSFTEFSESLFDEQSIKLIVTDELGCKDSIEKNIQVSHPKADFNSNFLGNNVDANGNFSCPSVLGQFSNQSSSIGNITNYFWSFGDGMSSNLVNPQTVFVFSGYYNGFLRIEDEFGCIDSVLKKIYYLSTDQPLH